MTIEMDSDFDQSLVSQIQTIPHVYNTILLKL